MLWVRLPPEPLIDDLPSWSSQECSRPCQGRGRGFESPRGRWNGTVRKPAKRPSSNLGERLWVRLPPVLLGWCSPQRSVKPLFPTRWGGDERFDSSTAHCDA